MALVSTCLEVIFPVSIKCLAPSMLVTHPNWTLFKSLHLFHIVSDGSFPLQPFFPTGFLGWKGFWRTRSVFPFPSSLSSLLFLLCTEITGGCHWLISDPHGTSMLMTPPLYIILSLLSSHVFIVIICRLDHHYQLIPIIHISQSDKLCTLQNGNVIYWEI